MQRIDTSHWKRWDYIRFYMQQWGCSVIPVAETKKPMVQWTKYQNTQPTEAELKAWFNSPCEAFRVPPWGIAIVLAHDLFSIDLDTEEVYKELKSGRAFPPGACLYKSAKGYHVIMRSNTGTPKTVREHNPVLTEINPLFEELGIGGDNNHLSNMPDTPDRHWIDLYDKPLAVDYNAWLKKHLHWTHDDQFQAAGPANWLDEIFCPWHELNDQEGHTPSLRCNMATGGFICHGCGKQGKFTELVEYSESAGYKLPAPVYEWVADFKNRSKPVIAPSEEREQLLFSADEEIVLEELPPALVDGVMWRNDVGLLYGPPTQGKSALCTSCCADLITGGMFWGIEGWQCQDDLRVLYVDLENNQGESRAAIRAATGKSSDALKRCHIMELVGQGFDINNREWAKYLETNIEQLDVDVVIVDNLGKFTGKNTIEDYEMKLICNQVLRVLARKYNILVILVHHTGHISYFEDGTVRPTHPKGGSTLMEDVNFSFELMRIPGKPNDTRITTKKIRSRRATIQLDDSFVLKYDKQTMHVAPATVQVTMAMARYLVEQHGQQEAAELIGVTARAMRYYTDGQRQPRGGERKRLETICEDEGYVPRLADIT